MKRLRRSVFSAAAVISLLVAVVLFIPVALRLDAKVDLFHNQTPKIAFSQTNERGPMGYLGASLDIQLHNWTLNSETMSWFPNAWAVGFFFLLIPTLRLQVYLKENKRRKENLISN